MTYLFDANTFIEANNRYYAMNVCPAYWEWIKKSHDSSLVISVTNVRDELVSYGDDLSEWAKTNGDIFKPVSDEGVQGAFGEVVNYLTTVQGMKPGALDRFLSGADPWLIAKAMNDGLTVVTHENYSPEIKKDFKIPNVCEHFGIPYLDTFQVLAALEAKFILQG